jgi:hypothetical protein
VSNGLDPAIWAAVATIVSVLISTVVTLFVVYVVEPKKWRSRYGVKALEKALEVHGWLVSILRACQEKAKRQEGATDKEPHLLESSDIWTLEEIFGKKAYLLSDRLKQTWYDLQRKDKYFAMVGAKYRRTTKSSPITVKEGEMEIGVPPLELTQETCGSDLTEMQKEAEADFAGLQSRYAKMTGFKPLD